MRTGALCVSLPSGRISSILFVRRLQSDAKAIRGHHRWRPAGLTAAWELVKDGGSEQYDVTVLEATREFGGISRTVKHDGNRMDIGGHRFFSKDDRIMDWWKDVLPLQGAPSYDDKKLHREHDMEPGGRIRKSKTR